LGTELHQLLKVPILIQHYLEHKTETPSITFIQFLSLHYRSEPVFDADYRRDMQLPFKTADCASAFFPVLDEPVSLEIKIPVPELKNEYANPGDFGYANPSLVAIFQPPRMA
jgi:hypothetical protein